LSQNELARLEAMIRQQLYGCWNPKVNMVVSVSFSLSRDGSLAGEPSVINPASGVQFQIAAEDAVRAVRACSPLRLPAAKYELWQDIVVDFNPRDYFGG
jgi:colicin import membrane protein